MHYDGSSLITVLIAVAGWFIVSLLRDKHAIKERKREIVVGYLIDAYRVLSNWVHRKNLSEEEECKIEKVISDIQLLGSRETIEILNQFLGEYHNNMSADPTRLLNLLNLELRSELKLDEIDFSKRQFFRFKK